jgi:ubiquinone/menaquinone biosynthesis C-methylase UbiE
VTEKATNKEFADYYASSSRKRLFAWVDYQKRALLGRHLDARSNLTVLDLGCGECNVTAQWAGRHQVHGVDHDPELLRRAAAKGVVTAVGTLDSAPYPDGTFDAVIMIDTIEHVESRERCLAEVKRLLKADGAFIAITPRYDSLLWNMGERFAHWVTGRNESGHISPYVTESLTYWMNMHFKRAEIGRLNFGMWIYTIAQDKRP